MKINTSEPVQAFRLQLQALTNVPCANQKIMGFPGGVLKASSWTEIPLSPKVDKISVVMSGESAAATSVSPAPAAPASSSGCLAVADDAALLDVAVKTGQGAVISFPQLSRECLIGRIKLLLSQTPHCGQPVNMKLIYKGKPHVCTFFLFFVFLFSFFFFLEFTIDVSVFCVVHTMDYAILKHVMFLLMSVCQFAGSVLNDDTSLAAACYSEQHYLHLIVLKPAVPVETHFAIAPLQQTQSSHSKPIRRLSFPILSFRIVLLPRRCNRMSAVLRIRRTKLAACHRMQALGLRCSA